MTELQKQRIETTADINSTGEATESNDRSMDPNFDNMM